MVVDSGWGLFGFNEITSVPSGLRVRGNVDVRDCVSLRSLPSNVWAAGDVYLRGCISLSEIGDVRFAGAIGDSGGVMCTPEQTNPTKALASLEKVSGQTSLNDVYLATPWQQLTFGPA
mmetsp:Transcript_24490/g.69172  ORF Transcript_24490/g.69172 Transcript_24490/m.69172 type:complete len:118 (+) Transcript_24490:175-528(+)